MQPSVKNWIQQMEELKDRAHALPEGSERDLFLKQADQLDHAIEMTNLAVKKSRKHRSSTRTAAGDE